MFGNNYLEEFKNASSQLEEAKKFWTHTIITMDPFARKLILDQYDSFVWVLSEEIQNYKNQLEPRMGLPLKLPPDLQKKANTLEAISSALKIIRQAIRNEDYEGENYLYHLPIPPDLNTLYKKRRKQISTDFPRSQLNSNKKSNTNSIKEKIAKVSKEMVEKSKNSWDGFYSEFDGKFDEEQSLGIELFDNEEVREKLEKLGYKINTSNFLDCTKVGEYFPTISDESEESVIIVFHKLPLDFDFDEGNNLVKKWFGFYKKYIKSLDPYFMEDESTEVKEDKSTEVKSSEKLQYLKNFTKNWFESESKEWLNFLVEKTKERTYGHFESKPEEFWWDPKKVEDWEYECAAALTASCIDQYESKGKEFVTEMLRAHFAETNSIGEELSTKIQMILLHSSMIGFENYFLNDCKLGGNESIKLTDEIVLKAFKIDLN